MTSRFALLILAAATTAWADVAPAAPGTRAVPPSPPVAHAPTAPTPTLAEMLPQFPGTWAGEQRVISPAKTVMRVTVSETYRLETEDKRPVLLGDIRYTVGAGAPAKTFHASSRTWADADGRGHAEVTQDGKTEKFDAAMRGDSLVFLPTGHTDDAESGTGVRVVTEGPARVMLVRGFQKSPQGTFVIEGRLVKTGGR